MIRAAPTIPRIATHGRDNPTWNLNIRMLPTAITIAPATTTAILFAPVMAFLPQVKAWHQILQVTELLDREESVRKQQVL